MLLALLTDSILQQKRLKVANTLAYCNISVLTTPNRVLKYQPKFFFALAAKALSYSVSEEKKIGKIILCHRQ
jgi:hypothetical protein